MHSLRIRMPIKLKCIYIYNDIVLICKRLVPLLINIGEMKGTTKLLHVIDDMLVIFHNCDELDIHDAWEIPSSVVQILYTCMIAYYAWHTQVI